ncbi:MAG: DUF4097 family beta strand repeat-containing protein [Gemmatimonadales bacterium]
MLLLTMTALAFASFQQGATPPRPPHPPRAPLVAVPRVHVDVWADRDDRSDEDGGGITDTTIAVQKGVRLSVDNFSGHITVIGWDQDKVRIKTGARDESGVDVSGGTVTLRVNGNGGRWGDQDDHDITLSVPAWMELDLSGNEVDIDVSGVSSSVRAETVEGTVSLKGGNGNVSLKSVDGDISIAGAKGRIQLNTVEGEIRATDVAGDLDVQSVDGEITLERVDSRSVTASSVDGAIRFSGPINAGGTYHLESHDGDVVLLTDGPPDAVMSISTFDGEFESDYPVTVTGANSNRRMTFTLGAGKARVELETFDGKISLRRAPAR